MKNKIRLAVILLFAFLISQQSFSQCSNITSGGTIGFDQSNCGLYNAITSNVTLPSGGTGTIEYQWQSSPNGTTWTVIPGATLSNYSSTVTSTTYYKRFSRRSGCATYDGVSNVVIKTVNPNPPFQILTVDGPTVICSGVDYPTLSISAVPGATYQWYGLSSNIAIPGATTTAYDAFYSGTYYVVTTYPSTGCHSSSNNVNILDLSNPVITFTSNGTSICNGVPVVLTVTYADATGYQWYRNGILVANSGSSYSATLPGDYTCWVQDYCWSHGLNTITLTQNNPPSASITGGTSACASSFVTLTANTGTNYTYQWKLNGSSISGATAITYSANATGSYTCAVTNSCGTTISNAIVVTIISAPQASITAGGTTTFCSGGSVMLSSNTDPNFFYYWRRNGTLISGATTSSYNATTAGSYLCQIVTTCGSTYSNAITVTVNTPPAVPSITANGSTTFCTGNFVTLTSSTAAGINYQWKQNGASIFGATSSTYNASSNGNYTCTVSNSCGSATSNAITIAVNTVTAAPGNITGQTSGVCSSTKTYSIGSVAGAGSYIWTVPAGASISSGQGTISVNIAFTNSFGSGNVSVVAVNNCGNSNASSINVSGLPLMPGSITGPPSVCHNQNNVIYSIAAVAGATSYTWTVPAGTNIKTGQGSTSIKVRFGNAAGNVTVKANNSCGSGAVRSLAVAMPCRELQESLTEAETETIIYPNPSANQFTVEFSDKPEADYSLTVLDITGNAISTYNGIRSGSFVFGEALSAGIYFVEIRSGDEQKIIKLVKN